MKGGAISVAVSGLHLGENAQPGPGVIRSLREAALTTKQPGTMRIIGLAYDALDSSLYTPGLLDEAFLLPYPSASPEAYLTRLLEVHALCRIDVLIPCLDSELPVLQRLAPDLEKHGIRCVLPLREALQRRTKAQLPELAQQLGIQVPETIGVTCLSTLSRAVSKLKYPCVVKGPFCDAEVVHGFDQASAAFERLSAQWGLPLLVQRFVRGDEYNVAALGDGKGNMCGAVAMRKTIVTRLGKAWGAMTVHDPSVISVAEKLVRELSWRGGCEIEVLKESSGAIHLIEVNPRFPAWIYLSTASGVNLPYGLLRMALGKELPPFERHRAGVFYVRHASEAIGNISDLENIVQQGRVATSTTQAFDALA